MVELTEKEVFIIDELLKNEQMLVKKYRLYAQNCSDASVSELCNNAADIHLKHFNTVISYLK